MVVTELALTVVLLAGAGLMIRSFMNLETLDVGFPIDHLMTMRMQLPETKYPTAEARRAFYERLEPGSRRSLASSRSRSRRLCRRFQAGERPFEIDGRPARQPADAGARPSRR